ncbi:unnamed protein product [Urochloa humidicola]
MSSTTAPNLAGLWFGELASAWQAVSARHGGQQQRRLLQAGPGEQKQQKVAAPAAAATTARRKAAEDGDNVVRCGGAMSDTTLYLLLDRFAPN